MARFSIIFNSLNTIIIVLLLVFTIANYFTMVDKFRGLSDFRRGDSRQESENQIPIREHRRNALLAAEQVRKSVFKHAVGRENRKFYSQLRIEAFCPSIHRIGDNGDGGKMVCNPRAVREDCTLLSLGLNNQIDYDKAIMNATDRKCSIIAADKDQQNMNTLRAYGELKGRVFSAKIPDELTIHQIMEQSYRKDVEILKMDIEGSEFTALEPFLKEHYVCQILIEIHGWPPEHLELLQKIARLGFRIFNIEENRLCTRCCEYSLINELCMSQFGAVPLAINIPF